MRPGFFKEVTVGIISVPNSDNDPKHWWRYSEGIREIFGSFHSRYRLPFEMALLGVYRSDNSRGCRETMEALDTSFMPVA